MTGSGKAVSSESGTLHTQSDGMFESVSVGTAEAGASKFECELKRKKKRQCVLMLENTIPLHETNVTA